MERLIVTAIKDVITVRSHKEAHITIRNRTSYALSFCKSGRIEYEHNGQRFISRPGVAVFHPQGATYRLYRQESGEFPLINFYLDPETAPQEFRVFPLRDAAWYLREVEELRELSLLSHNRLLVMGRLYGIFHRLCNDMREQKGAVSFLLDYIAAHYEDPALSNEKLAQAAGISEVYMRQLFGREVGISPKRYIQQLRLQKACQMLAEGRETVTNVARCCGFSDIYPFCRAFKTAFGITPSEYRRQNRMRL